MKMSDINDLDFNNAGSWPLPIKLFAVILVMAAVGAAGYYFDSKELLAELERTERKEIELKREFEKKQSVMANIDAYRAQLDELQSMLGEMLQQLPTATEMPNLLDDISNTGRANGLDFELFRPQNEIEQGLFAAKPIVIRARATYHQFASFISEVSALPRIVTLETAKITVENPRDGQDIQDEESLLIDATLSTYRYLEDEPEEDVEG